MKVKYMGACSEVAIPGAGRFSRGEVVTVSRKTGEMLLKNYDFEIFLDEPIFKEEKVEELIEEELPIPEPEVEDVLEEEEPEEEPEIIPEEPQEEDIDVLEEEPQEEPEGGIEDTEEIQEEKEKNKEV